MSELKPTDKGYIEALAKRYDNFVSGITQDEIRTAKFDFTQGYESALEHNNVPELIEAAKNVLKDVEDRLQSLGVYGIEDSLFSESLLKLQSEVTKAEKNKLNK